MLNIKQAAKAAIFTVAVAAQCVSMAAEWRVNSVHYEFPWSLTADGIDFDVSEATFFDGAFQPTYQRYQGYESAIDFQNVAVSSWAPDGLSGHVLSFWYSYEILTRDSRPWAPVVAGQGQAPLVDLPNMRADFSALWLTMFLKNSGTMPYHPDPDALRYPSVPAQAYVPGGGWNLGAPGWVPLVANSDGSYTATWAPPYPTNDWVSAGRQVILNFSPVPEANLSGMVLAGLGVLSLRLRRRQA